jgi:hypothetical protein
VLGLRLQMTGGKADALRAALVAADTAASGQLDDAQMEAAFQAAGTATKLQPASLHPACLVAGTSGTTASVPGTQTPSRSCG